MSFLIDITAKRRADARSRAAALSDLAARASDLSAPVNFEAALRSQGLSLIAEVKRSSPSVGTIDQDVDPAERAAAYEDAGASAVSVLTEPEFFSGSLEDLARAAKSTNLPVLRKDFLCEPLHLYEAKVGGASAVLLIVAALSPQELADLIALASQLALTPLVEVHETDEVGVAIEAGARIVGINTRNLLTLKVDPNQVARVRPQVPTGIAVVGESGIKTRADVEPLESLPVDAILVGEALMRAKDVGEKVKELLGK